MKKRSSQISSKRLFSVQFPASRDVTHWRTLSPKVRLYSEAMMGETVKAIGSIARGESFTWGQGHETTRRLGRWIWELLDLDVEDSEALMFWLHNHGLGAFVPFSRVARELAQKRSGAVVTIKHVKQLSRSLRAFRDRQQSLRETMKLWFSPHVNPLEAYSKTQGDERAAWAWDHARVSMQRPWVGDEPVLTVEARDEPVVLTVEASDPFALAVIELVWCVRAGKVLRICQRCEKMFFPAERSDEIYCERPVPGRFKRGTQRPATCKDLGPIETYRKKLETDPLGLKFDRLRRRVLMKFGKDDQTYLAWVARAKTLLSTARREHWPPEKFERQLSGDPQRGSE